MPNDARPAASAPPTAAARRPPAAAGDDAAAPAREAPEEPGVILPISPEDRFRRSCLPDPIDRDCRHCLTNPPGLP